MKCPILLIAWMQTKVGNYGVSPDCLGKDCGWWDLELNQCSVVTLARQIHNIYSELDLIADKMPFAGQFTK